TVTESVRKRDMLLIRDVVKVWDAKTFALKQTLGNDSQLTCVGFSPNGKLIAAGDPGKKVVLLWNAGTGALERALKTEAQPWSLAFSPDGKTLAVGGQKSDHSGEVQLWDVRAGKLKHVFEQDKYVNAVAFSPDSKMVVASTGGKLVQLLGVEKGD